MANSGSERIKPHSSDKNHSADISGSSEFFETPNYESLRDNFTTALQKASKGEPSSLSFIRNPMPEKSLIKNGVIQGIVVGGTNFETQWAHVFNGDIRMIPELEQKGTVPPFPDFQSLLDFLKTHIDPHADGIGINLAYPLAPKQGPHGELDGVILYGTKGNTFDQVPKEPLGQLLQNTMNLAIPISVANDTVCLGENGLVVGSGFNMSIATTEGNTHFRVNLEAGNFNDEANSKNKGAARYEKMLSGMYLAQHYNLLAQANRLSVSSVINGEMITNLAENDKGAAGQLARDLLERSASLVAVPIAAVYTFLEQPEHLTFAADGSVLKKGWQFATNVHKRLTRLGVPKGAIQFEQTQDAALQGA